MNTVDQNDPVAMAIAQANQAAQAAMAVNQVAVVSTPQNTAVSTQVGTAKALTMETVSTGTLSVDSWLKPKEYGLLIGDSSKLFPTCRASIDMTDGRGFVVKRAVKGGNPAQYAYTRDGVTCVSGGSWEAAVQKMKQLDPKCSGEYRCVDLPFTLLEDVVVGNETIMAAGKTLGYTTSTTNWKNWEMFYKAVAEAGLMGRVVEVELSAEPRSNKAGNKWGVLQFKLIGELLTDETE